MIMDITSYLLSAQSTDVKIRIEAENGLKLLQEKDSSLFLSSLASELSNENKSIESRRLAGIVLKNSLDAKDASTKKHLAQKWMAEAANVRSYIKDSLVRTIRSQAQGAWHTSAQVISKIAAIEIPEKQWEDLIPFLLVNMIHSDCPHSCKQATLETLGYVCEEILHQELEHTEVLVVLEVIAHSMNVVSAASKAPSKEATFDLSSILDGPAVESLSTSILLCLEFVLKKTKDQNIRVRNTAASILSRIFELLRSPVSRFSVITAANIQPVLSFLLECLKDAPNVAQETCKTIHDLLQGFEDVKSSPINLTPLISNIIASLMATADRTDVTDSKLRSAAYDTLNVTVRCAKLPENALTIEKLLDVMMNKLSLSFDRLINQEKQGNFQTLSSRVFYVIIEKLNTVYTKEILLYSADDIMILLLKIFAGRRTVQKEGMLAIGNLAYAIGSKFVKYMPDFYKYLEMGLQNLEEYQVCSITVGVVSNICRALEKKILPFCDGIMALLLKNLSSEVLHCSVKPQIFSCFADIALAIGPVFEKYLPYSISMMQSASDKCACLDMSDDKIMEYGNLLRCSIFEAHSGILQGFKEAKPDLLVPHAKQLLEFLQFVFGDKKRDKGVTKAAVTVLGHLADSLGPKLKKFLNGCSFYDEFINECLRCDDHQVIDAAKLTQDVIKRIMVSY